MSRTFRKCALTLTGAVGVMALVAALSSPTKAMADGPDDSAAEAFAAGKGIGVAQARKQLEREAGQSATARTMTEKLGTARTAGAWIDDAGSLKIAVTQRSDAAAVSRAGATPVVVKHSSDELTAITGRLDRAARSGQVDDLQAWSIDVTTNQVVVTTRTGLTEKASKQLTSAASTSGALRVEQTAGQMTLTADLYGGREYVINNQGLCSSGFSARDQSGRGVMLTAGHCVKGAQTFTMNGQSLGAVRGFSFPGDDYAAINLTASWTPRGQIERYNGGSVAVKGSQVAAVGASVCKSGRTTGWTCGSVQAYNNTVNYGGGDVVSGLTRHNACVEQGDSGGSNMSGSQAQGLTSGASLYQSGGRLVCGAKVGAATTSYFQPVNEALGAYGLTLVTE